MESLFSADILASAIVDWDRCHVCGGPVEGGNFTVDGIYVYQEVTCAGDCPSRSWTEIYEARMRIMQP